jgi:hypothetical protein
MKRIVFYSMVAVLLLTVAACGKKEQPAGRCHIVGVAPNPTLEGKRIFLVPFSGPATAETVDSIEIHDGKFEFDTDTLMMAKILIDYHYRLGFQPLLVVVEPGEVKVVVDSISSASGTPQNDSLQVWKEATERHNAQLVNLRKNNMNAQADSIHLAYKKYTRQMAANMKEGLLHDFLNSLYPLTYKRKLSDGRTITVNADTNEEIK